ncbi:helix-turn-helix domain-containing protein [Mycobacterium scrofulaceum]|uniref:Helix-turn-helix domain-containing protein n=1 Tax=Mycobacterium scrofulaceum TaxID=1783 RepID=A0A1X0KKU3_MYCSC|nr:helix-turn-helix domain-containing protein [Mycobacterium scrofulaceum]ORB75846.1 hypothetical protein BST44_02720 [Mycobacterium scrofulaceum]
MNAANREAHVRREMEELGQQLQHLPGGAAVLSAPVLVLMRALIAGVHSELAGSDRILSAQYEALWRVLAPSCRVGRDGQRDWGTAGLGFRNEVDPETAATALGMKPDTVRKHLRRGTIRGRKVGQQWRIPLSAVEEFSRKVA